MFGSDIIRVKIRGYLKNIDEDEIFKFDEKGIRNKDKITYNDSDVKYTIKIEDKKIIIIREGKDFINTLIFSEIKSTGNYFLKEEGYDIDIDISVIEMNINDNSIFIKYKVVDSDVSYEFKLEVSDIL